MAHKLAHQHRLMEEQTLMPSSAAENLTTTGCPPFLRWAGSKRRLLPALKGFWSKDHLRYIEPFAGSACLFFEINPPKAVLGDLNRELIGTYIELKYRIDPVLDHLRSLPQWDKQEYLRLRNLEPESLPNHERAARFIYLNRFCFNGIYRTNLSGKFNVPYSGDGCGGLPKDSVFENCARMLKNAKFIRGDFEKVLRQARKGDFVYMDPPYAVKASRVFREYDPETFNPLDIDRLYQWMKRLDATGIDFVVSYVESDEANLLKKGFRYETVAVRRNVAGFAAHRVIANEVLITNITRTICHS